MRQNRIPQNRITRRSFLKNSLVLGASLALSSCFKSGSSGENVPDDADLAEPVIQDASSEPEETISPSPTDGGIIWYVDIEHENAVRDPDRKENFDYVRQQRTQIVGLAAGLPSESVHYWEISPELALEKNVRAICISGNTTDWWEYDFARFDPLFQLIEEHAMPTLGLCGGHQLLALLFGGSCDAIRLLEADETDLDPSWAPGYYKEIGFMPVEVLVTDPIFNNCGNPPIFFESHYWEVKELPETLISLAHTPEVAVQVLKHVNLPVYGTQFHPEVYDLKNPDGATLLKNFFSITLNR